MMHCMGFKIMFFVWLTLFEALQQNDKNPLLYAVFVYSLIIICSKHSYRYLRCGNEEAALSPHLGDLTLELGRLTAKEGCVKYGVWQMVVDTIQEDQAKR